MKPRYDPRVFLALTISPSNKQRLGALQAIFKPVLESWHFIPLENFHVTLRFYGEIAEEEIGGIGAACREIAASLPPFTLEWNGVDYFGSPKTARVLFAAAKTNDRLTQLTQQLEHIGPAAEHPRRDFTPHITLAKARTQMDAASARASMNVLARLREQHKVGAQAIELAMNTVHLEFVLMETVWVGRHVQYVIRENYTLGGEE
jgi:2'-5' RNA ligase